MLTQRAFLLGFVALCLYLVAVVNTLPGYFYVLTWLAVGLLVASLGLALTSLSGLELGWRVVSARGTARPLADESSDEMGAWAGAPPLLEISLHNRASLSKVGLVLELVAEAEGGKDEQILSFLVEALGAGRSAVAEVPLDALPRGVYQLREARLVGSDVLGLFRLRRRIVLGELPVLVVAPPLIGLSPRELRAAGQEQSGTRRARLHRGDELRGLRPYASGDDLRHVHWKSSARVGELVVREWEQPGRASALVVWHGVSAAPISSQTGVSISPQIQIAACELGLSLCGSLALALGRSGAPVTLVCAGAEVERVETPALDGSALPGEFIDLLARTQISERADPEALAPHRHGRDLFAQNDLALIVAPFPRSSEELERILPPRRAGREGSGRTIIVLIDATNLNSQRPNSPSSGARKRRSSESPAPFSFGEVAARLRARGLESLAVAPTSAAQTPESLRVAVAQLV